MMFKKFASALILTVGTVLAAPGQAAVLFSDNFDSDNAASALNFDSLINWTVSGGTIDYIRQGGFGLSCFGGTGGCLDMDGSTSNAGRITSKATFNLVPGIWYWLEAQVSGNQRGGAADSFEFGFIDASTDLRLGFGTQSGIAPDSPFSLRGVGIFTDAPFTVRLFFEGIGGDNVGVILDNVVFRDESQGVPEPGTLALLGLGLAGLAATRRRKQ